MLTDLLDEIFLTFNACPKEVAGQLNSQSVAPMSGEKAFLDQIGDGTSIQRFRNSKYVLTTYLAGVATDYSPGMCIYTAFLA